MLALVRFVSGSLERSDAFLNLFLQPDFDE
jgi:hypothetical protein